MKTKSKLRSTERKLLIHYYANDVWIYNLKMKCLQSIKLFYFEGRKATFLNQNISEFFLTTYKHKNVMNPQSCTIISFQNDFLFRQFEKNQGYPMKIFFNSQIQCCFFFSTCKSGRKILEMPSYQHRTKTATLETWGFTAEIKIFSFSQMESFCSSRIYYPAYLLFCHG